MNKRLVFLLLLVISFNVDAQALNKDGSVVTGVLTAGFDPGATFSASGEPVLPFPTSLLYTGTTDLTLNIPVDDPSDYGDPAVALSSLDGYSTIEKWVVSFSNGTPGNYDNAIPGSIDPSSVVPGQSVRVFEVTTSQFVAVTSIVAELTPWVDYIALAVTADKIAILPLRPLKEYTSYMAVLTNDIRDVDGNDATPDRTYCLGKTSVPWVDENGNSTYGLFDDETAAGLETIRQITQSMELNAASVGINPDDIVLSWTVHTQSITRTLKTLHAFSQPAPTIIAPTGMTTAAIGGFGLADINIGVITMPYYSGIPTAENLTAALTDFWKAAPGAYVPPFDEFGLDPTSTNITVANPIPVVTGMQTVPLIMAVPNSSSGHSKPADGWPVVMFGHGITRNRTDALALADTLASIGYAVVAIDSPVHGVSPDAQPELAPFYIEYTPFASIANERTFDMDLINNATGAPGPDGLIDPSGTHSVSAGLSSMLTGRDTFRQGVADLFALAHSIPSMDIDSDGSPDMDASNIAYVGISWGGLHGTVFTAIETDVTRAFLSVPGGGIARFAEASPTFGPVIRAGLKAAVGLEPGTADYEQFFLIWQTVLDSADPINWGADAAALTPLMVHEVINDQVIPNLVPGAPLSGTEALMAVMGLTSYGTSQQSPDGLRAAGRFLPPASHGSLLSPDSSLDALVEMQTQMASFIASHGGQILVTNESTMVQEVEMEAARVVNPTVAKAGSAKKRSGTVYRQDSEDPSRLINRSK
jgi:pimeloyl-ACP methyl ester carboxylesterase